jgi:hypothetical protein
VSPGFVFGDQNASSGPVLAGSQGSKTLDQGLGTRSTFPALQCELLRHSVGLQPQHLTTRLLSFSHGKPVIRLTRSCRLQLCLGLIHIAPAQALYAQADAQWLSSQVSRWYEAAALSAPGQWGIAIADQ